MRLKYFLLVQGLLLTTQFVFAQQEPDCTLFGLQGHASMKDGKCFPQENKVLEKATASSTAISEKIVLYQWVVDTLSDKIKNLKESQKQNNAPVNPLDINCLDLKNNLLLGKSDKETDGEVSKLQQFLGKYKSNKIYTLYPNNQMGASAEDFQPVTGYYGSKTAMNVMEWQKDHGMDFVTTSSGVGTLTRSKMRCGNTPNNQTVQKINWSIELANPKITDENDFQKHAQAISIDVTFTDNSTKHYKLGTAYGCTGSTIQSVENGRNIFGKIKCYYSLSGVEFTAYSKNGKFTVERGDESAMDGSIKTTLLLQI